MVANTNLKYVYFKNIGKEEGASLKMTNIKKPSKRGRADLHCLNL